MSLWIFRLECRYFSSKNIVKCSIIKTFNIVFMML
jgi:hypothetical protein